MAWGWTRADLLPLSIGQLIEWHGLHTEVHAKRRLEEMQVAAWPHLNEAGRRRVHQQFEQYTRPAGEPAPEQVESEMPLSAEDFARMMKEEHG